MANCLSIGANIAGLISLTGDIVTAGYRCMDSILSAPEEFQNLVREAATLSVIFSQIISHDSSLQTPRSPGTEHAISMLAKQGIFQECEESLRHAHQIIRDCKRIFGLEIRVWPSKREAVVESYDRLHAIRESLHATISIDSASALRRIEHRQDSTHALVTSLSHIGDQAQTRRVLDWLSPLDPATKHEVITGLQQPGTGDWLLEEQAISEWLHDGTLFWLNGTSGIGKTVLV